jgi:Zn-dependent protease
MDAILGAGRQPAWRGRKPYTGPGATANRCYGGVIVSDPYAGSYPASFPDTPTQTRSPRAAQRDRRGIAGGLAAIGLSIAKYGALLFKVGKLGPTLISMAISLVLLAQIYGLAFGAGVLLLIAVHESGHMLFAKYERLPVSAPIFLGFFGAVIGLKSPPKDARQEAVVAIGGPVVGSLGALAVYLLALSMPEGHTRLVLIAIAYFGFFINLFNLVPVVPFDGGRVASALSVYANIVGLVIMAALLVFSAAAHLSSPFLFILLILGAYSTYKRFQTARANPQYLASVPRRTRSYIALAYVAMLALTALGMGATHASLVDHNVVSVSDSSQ